MATRVGTILSDENVMKHCAIYRPIPMHLTKSVLHSTQTETQYGKKLKYPSPLLRPTNFDTLATTLTRHSGNDPDVRDRLMTSILISKFRYAQETPLKVSVQIRNENLHLD